MTNNNREAFARAMVVLGETFHETVSELRLESYFHALSDIEWPRLEFAMQEALRTLKWFPKPVELRELACGRIEDDAEEAWGLALDAARSVGSYGVPQLPESIAQTLRSVFGGWQRFCASDLSGPEGIGWRKQFVRAFEVYARRQQQAVRALTHAESVDALAQIRQRMLPPSGESR